jgi:hypothetical protein
MALFPFTGPGGSGRRFTYTFTRATSRSFQKIGRRAPGNPLLVTPGRQRATPQG